MNPILIGVSLFATLLSTISYLSMPGEGAGKGPVFLVSMLAYPVIYWVIAHLLLPVYMQYRVTSAYELLESRLGLSVRLLGASMFLVLRLVWMTLLVNAASAAMIVMMGIDPKWTPLVAGIIGAVAITYTSLGGLQAVIITDFMQTVLLAGGAVLVVATISFALGGFQWFPTTWQPTWDTQPIFSWDPKTRTTAVGSVLSVLIWYVATMGGDQTSVQRFMATTNLAAARKAVRIQLAITVGVHFLLFLTGFALLSYFRSNPQFLPSDIDIKANADQLFPRYIAFHLPAGISGLVAAAMFAAAMSSVDSGVNSITAVVQTDFLDRLGFRPASERTHIWISRLLALLIGGVVVSCSSLVDYVQGNIMAITNKTVNLLAVPIFCLFVFALFIPKAKPLGVWIGSLVGFAVAVLIAFSGPIVYWLHMRWNVPLETFGVELLPSGQSAQDPISFQWIGPVTLIADLTVGTLVSWMLARRDKTIAVSA